MPWGDSVFSLVCLLLFVIYCTWTGLKTGHLLVLSLIDANVFIAAITASTNKQLPNMISLRCVAVTTMFQYKGSESSCTHLQDGNKTTHKLMPRLFCLRLSDHSPICSRVGHVWSNVICIIFTFTWKCAAFIMSWFSRYSIFH